MVFKIMSLDEIIMGMNEDRDGKRSKNCAQGLFSILRGQKDEVASIKASEKEKPVREKIQCSFFHIIPHHPSLLLLLNTFDWHCCITSIHLPNLSLHTNFSERTSLIPNIKFSLLITTHWSLPS